MTINYLINELINYNINKELINELDYIYCGNKLIFLLKLDAFDKEEIYNIRDINQILDDICLYAYENNIINSIDVTTKDLFDTLIMDIFTPIPSIVNQRFNNLYKINPIDSTNYLYNLSINSNYIRMDRINKNICYKYESNYGIMDITINLSKPEKDPKIIALAKNIKQTGYPKCMLCKECVGFSGNLNFPARENLRTIKLDLNNQCYYLQYSPYGYYNEHCIVFNEEHIPMVINKNTFNNLCAFVKQFPHYFIGSNADLPIVGGSILTHDHYQGGCYNFPMFDAEDVIKFKEYNDVFISYIKWPLDTIKLVSDNIINIVDVSDKILKLWKEYSNSNIKIFNNNNNTITPIVRYNNNKYEMYLVLRNNYTDDEHPYGLYHPNESLHHIKKENIGLIEVMGLAVLPKRLVDEMKQLKEVFISNNISLLDSDLLLKHKNWYYEIQESNHNINNTNIDIILNNEIGKVFVKVLEDCSVFKYANKKLEEITKFINKLY